MALVLSFLTTLIINNVYGGEPSRDLTQIEAPTKIAFYDFDRTLATISYGGVIVKLCRGFYNSTYITNPCDAEDELLETYLDLPDPTLSAKMAFGNQTRIDRLKKHLDIMLGEKSPIKSNGIYIVSTSWGEVPAKEWQKFIGAVLERVELDTYFPYANILTLDDPGENIQADKGAPIKDTIKALGIDISQAECIFADDKQGNLNWALSDKDVVDPAGRNYCDTLLIQERDGMDGTDFNYNEARTVLGNDDCSGVNAIGLKTTISAVFVFVYLAFV